MFGKDTEKLKSFLGAESEVKGEFVARGILRVDGAATGKIQADQVILSEAAVVNGDILARHIIVDGRAEGILRASDLVEIRAKGRVKGEIFAKKLLVANGAEFNGRIEMKAEEPKALDFELKNQGIALKG